MKKQLAALIALALPALAQQRIASDFEIAEMRQQLARSRSFSSQISGHLNLGDVYLARNERTTAVAEYRLALDIASKERAEARRDSDLARYARATSLAGLAAAKLADPQRAFSLLEESIRYSSTDAETWNVYASAMNVLRKPEKAVSAARNALFISSAELAKEPTLEHRVDVAVYRYSLASSLLDSGAADEALSLLTEVTTALRSSHFDALRARVARREAFEIYSTARGEEAAYLSLLNRAQLRLAALHESRGDVESARREYMRVLETRTDDATALAALARLTNTAAERARLFSAAFDANPFSLSLIREYQRSLTAATNVDEALTTGARMRRILVHIARGETRAARQLLDSLLVQFPGNETLLMLQREVEGRTDLPALEESPTGRDLRAILEALRASRLTPEQRAALDARTFKSLVVFTTATGTEQTILESGTIEGVPFRFGEPTAFAGTFGAKTPLLLTYRILGATEVSGADALLLEPIRLEPPQ